jgi:O-antigen ligase
MVDLLGDPVVALLAATAATACTIIFIYIGLGALAGNRTAIYIVVFLVIFLIDVIFRVRDYTDKSIDFQIILKVGTLCYAFLFALAWLPRYFSDLLKPAPLIWSAFFGWALYTTTYSPSPIYSLVSLFSVVSVFLFFIAVFGADEENGVLTTIVVTIATICCISLIVYVVAPGFGRLSEWRGNDFVVGTRLSGITGNPNAMGTIAAVALLILGLRWRDFNIQLGRKVCGALALPCGLALVLSHSRTSIASVILILTIRKVMQTGYRPFVILFFGTAFFAVLVMVPFIDQIMVLVSRSGNAAEIMTGTTRTQIWSMVSSLAEMRFWSGWGYASTIFVLPLYFDYMGESAPHAHNLFMQTWFCVGATGLILLVTALLLQIRQALYEKDSLSLGLIALVVFTGMMEPGAFAGMVNMATIALAIAVARGARHQTARNFASSKLYYPVGPRLA